MNRLSRSASLWLILAVLTLLSLTPLRAQDRQDTTPQKLAPAGPESPAAVPNSYIITLSVPMTRDGTFAPDAIAATRNGVLAALPESVRIKAIYSHIPVISVEMDAADLEIATRSPGIMAVMPDYIRELHDAESDILTEVPFLHDLGLKGKGVRVAVIDTGIDTDHPSKALTNSLFFERCFRTEGDCPNGENSAEDQNGHGTHVAGIITGKYGVAPAAKFAALKVLTTSNTSDTNILNALNYIIANNDTLKIDLVNMSLGGGAYTTELSCNTNNPAYIPVIASLNNLGITVFASTGNDFSPTKIAAPACVTGVIGVGSINDGNSVFCGTDVYAEVTCFSNATPLQGIGELVDVLAPGCAIYSEYIGGGFENLCGTSMASPTALGVAALLKGYNKSLTPAQIETILEDTGTLVIDRRNGTSYPAVNAKYAYWSLLVDKPTGLTITDTTATSVSLEWTDSPSESSYILERSANGRPFVTIATPPKNATSATDNALDCGVLVYRLRAVKNGNVSGPSDSVTQPAVVACPAVPTALGWSWTEPDGFWLTWIDNATGETVYVVERSADGGRNFVAIASIAADSTAYLDSALTSCGEYSYRVKAVHIADFESVSNYSNTVHAGCPPSNDLFASARPLTEAGDVEPAVYYAQSQSGDPVHSCAFTTGGASVWYTFTPSQNGYVTISTSGSTYDTVMSLLTGSPGSFTQVACNDDINPGNGIYQSAIVLAPVAAGTTYVVEVVSYDEDGPTAGAVLTISYSFLESLPVPDNDLFENAKPITSEVYTEVQPYAALATSSPDDPVLSCRYNGPGRGTHSLWYTFTVDGTSTVTIDTAGSSGTYSDTTIAVLTGTIGAFTEIACAEDTGFVLTSRIENLAVQPGITYYLYVARWSNTPTSSPGELHLDVRINTNLLLNGGFETGAGGGAAEAWGRRGAGSENDKRKCNPAKANNGDCAYLYKGGAGEKSILKQKVSSSILGSYGITPEVGDIFRAKMYVQGNSANGKISLIIKYADGTPATKMPVSFSSSADYTEVIAEEAIASAAVKNVTVKIVSKATSGKTFIDDVRLTHLNLPERGAVVLPPPPNAPDGFRGMN